MKPINLYICLIINNPARAKKAEDMTIQNIARPLPYWLEQDGLNLRWMSLDGSEMAFLGISLPSTMAGAVPKRKGEYRAGRTCARMAIQHVSSSLLTLEDSSTNWPINGADRAPIWPDGITGSLSHSNTLVTCIAGLSSRYESLGVDIEPPTSLSDSANFAHQVCLPQELAIVSQSGLSDAGFTLLFSAKEALFKAVYPTVKRYVDFHEAKLIGIDGDTLNFELSAGLSSDLGHIQTLEVKAAWWRQHILTFCQRDR